MRFVYVLFLLDCVLFIKAGILAQQKSSNNGKAISMNACIPDLQISAYCTSDTYKLNGLKSVTVVELTPTKYSISWKPWNQPYNFSYCNQIIPTEGGQIFTDSSPDDEKTLVYIVYDKQYIVNFPGNSFEIEQQDGNDKFVIFSSFSCNQKCTKAQGQRVPLRNGVFTFPYNDGVFISDIVTEPCANVLPFEKINVKQMNSSYVSVTWKLWENVKYCNQTTDSAFNFMDSMGLLQTAMSSSFKNNGWTFLNYGRINLATDNRNWEFSFCPAPSFKYLRMYSVVECDNKCSKTRDVVLPLETYAYFYGFSPSLPTKESTTTTSNRNPWDGNSFNPLKASYALTIGVLLTSVHFQ